MPVNRTSSNNRVSTQGSSAQSAAAILRVDTGPLHAALAARESEAAARAQLEQARQQVVAQAQLREVGQPGHLRREGAQAVVVQPQGAQPHHVAQRRGQPAEAVAPQQGGEPAGEPESVRRPGLHRLLPLDRRRFERAAGNTIFVRRL